MGIFAIFFMDMGYFSKFLKGYGIPEIPSTGTYLPFLLSLYAFKVYISTKLSLQGLKIVTCFRLGEKQANKTRPLKAILAENAQQKFMLENVKF